MLFRPLRLCMPAEKLRRVRIVLLKATHSPCVAAIWMYEHASRYLRGDDDHWHTSSHEKRSDLASRLSSSRQAKKAALTSHSDASLARSSTADWRPRTPGPDDLSEMKQLLQKLSARLDQQRR